MLKNKFEPRRGEIIITRNRIKKLKPRRGEIALNSSYITYHFNLIFLKTIWYPFGQVLAAIRFVLLIGSMAIVVGVGLLLVNLKIADQNLAFKIRTFWCKLALKILGIRLYVTGKIDLTEGTLYVGNHRSLIDPIVAFCFIDHGYAVSKIEVSTYPLVHTGAKLSGVIYVERSNSQSRSNKKEIIEQNLQEHKSILIFPEGTTGTEKTTLTFKKGSFEAAASTNHPVVAFAIEMGNPKSDFWYKEGLLSQYFRTYSKWRTDVYLHFFEPIKGNSGEELCFRCQQMINEKLAEFQKNWK